jgi:hypothetical protein
MSIRLLIASVTAPLCLFCCGCMPEAKAPLVTGPIDTTTASQLQGRVRISNGDRYSVEHQCNGQSFTATWELGNALKKNAKVQLKPPGDWSEGDVYQALEVVLAAHATKPWYSQIDDTVLRLYREALKDDNNRAVGMPPETPYDVAVKVNHYESEWFVEVKVQILDENGMALGI